MDINRKYSIEQSSVYEKHSEEPARLEPSGMELNGVANAVTILQAALRSEPIGKKSIEEAISELKLFCKFARKYEKSPLFWHEFKAQENKS